MKRTDENPRPKRILFFSGKQRRKTMGGMLYSWLLTLLVLVIAISINTALVDEIVRLLDVNIPLMRFSVERKLGWVVSAAAFAFAFLAVVSLFASSLILKVRLMTSMSR